jgi:cation diffusion facilitator CzcD-associated flavoprotein CzcO
LGCGEASAADNSGSCSNWKWPDIKGLHDFKGVLTHSARYDTSLDLTGKRVAVVGMGSSGIQIVSKIASQVKELYTWVRSPTWITAGFAQKFAGPDGQNFKYTDKQKKIFEEDPELFKRYSKMIESELNVRFKFILNGTPEAQAAKEFAANEMVQKLAGNEKLMDAMIPKNFGIGCRRPTPGNGFLEALNRDNVTTFTEEMRLITEKGFVDSTGQEHEVDVIICATGFNTSWVPRFSVTGRDGRTLASEWKTEPSSYISIAVPHFPNYWMQVGPYGPLGHGSFLPIVECLTGNIIQCIDKMQRECIKSMAPKEAVANSFVEHARLFLQRTAWSGPCSSWFKQGKIDGPLPMFPGTRLTYIDLLTNPRFEDYEIEYEGGHDMWRFLGNGFSTREFDGRDLSYYLGLVNGKDEQEDLEADLHGKLSELVH